MIKQDPISLLNVIPQQISCLVISYTLPARGLIRFFLQILDGVRRGLCLHQPILHRHFGSAIEKSGGKLCGSAKLSGLEKFFVDGVNLLPIQLLYAGIGVPRTC